MICATMKQYADFVSQFSQSVSFELRPEFIQLWNRTGHGAFQTIATSLGDSTRIFGEPIKLEKHNFSLKPEASYFCFLADLLILIEHRTFVNMANTV